MTRTANRLLRAVCSAVYICIYILIYVYIKKYTYMYMRAVRSSEECSCRIVTVVNEIFLLVN